MDVRASFATLTEEDRGPERGEICSGGYTVRWKEPGTQPQMHWSLNPGLSTYSVCELGQVLTSLSLSFLIYEVEIILTLQVRRAD